MDAGELDRIIRKLNEAKAISEWHFRDVGEEILGAYEGQEEPWE